MMRALLKVILAKLNLITNGRISEKSGRTRASSSAFRSSAAIPSKKKQIISVAI